MERGRVKGDEGSLEMRRESCGFLSLFPPGEFGLSWVSLV
jgi:hypothetical protein